MMNCAKQRNDWGRTAAVNQMIYWANKAKNVPSKSIADFNPWIEMEEAEFGTRELYQMLHCCKALIIGPRPNKANNAHIIINAKVVIT